MYNKNDTLNYQGRELLPGEILLQSFEHPFLPEFFVPRPRLFLLAFLSSILVASGACNPSSPSEGGAPLPPTACAEQGLYANLKEHPDPPPAHVLYDLLSSTQGLTPLRYDPSGGSGAGLSLLLQYGTILSVQPAPHRPYSLWLYGGAPTGFTLLARGESDEEGRALYSLTRSFPQGGSRLYLKVEPEGTCTLAGVFSFPQGTPVVITDIDGTLTASEGETFNQLADPLVLPDEFPDAPRMHRLYAEKGYTTIYLTARQDAYRHLTRVWLEAKGFPFGPLITAGPTPLVGDPAARYKATMVKRIKDEFQLEILAAYGNQESDARAYLEAGIPGNRIFMLPPFATGSDLLGTTPVTSYTLHIQGFVEPLPPCTTCPPHAP